MNNDLEIGKSKPINEINPEIDYLERLHKIDPKYLDKFFADSKQAQDLDEFKDKEKLRLNELEILNRQALAMAYVENERVKTIKNADGLRRGQIFGFLMVPMFLSAIYYLLQAGHKDLAIGAAAIIAAITAAIIAFTKYTKK